MDRFLIFFLALIFLINSCVSNKIQNVGNIDKIILVADNNQSLTLNPIKINSFLNDLNKIKKVDSRIIQICYEIEIINKNKTKEIYQTDGEFLIRDDIYYHSEYNLITKYWEILEENFCKEKTLLLQRKKH